MTMCYYFREMKEKDKQRCFLNYQQRRGEVSLKRRQTTLFHKVFNKVTLPQDLEESKRKR